MNCLENINEAKYYALVTENVYMKHNYSKYTFIGKIATKQNYCKFACRQSHNKCSNKGMRKPLNTVRKRLYSGRTNKASAWRRQLRSGKRVWAN